MAVPISAGPRRHRTRVGAWIIGLLACVALTAPATGTSVKERAAAGLRISASASHAATWRRVYGQMPQAWKSDRLIIVNELTGSDMDRLVGEESGGNPSARDDDSVVDGYYQNDGGTDEPVVISLRDSLRGQALQLVFAHEYAHFVWDDLMTTQQHRDYAALWRQQKRAHALVTDYAGESADEGFAEAASYYVVDRTALRRHDARSIGFIERMVSERGAARDREE